MDHKTSKSGRCKLQSQALKQESPLLLEVLSVLHSPLCSKSCSLAPFNMLGFFKKDKGTL